MKVRVKWRGRWHRFASVAEANTFCNEVIRRTGIVLAVVADKTPVADR
jgi:hypothetical protein